MIAKVILNPYSNRWKARENWPQVEELLYKYRIEFELAISEKRGQITELTAKAAQQGYSPILIAGGDGSMGEAVNGLAQSAKDLKQPIGPLGMIPLGTANDLAHNLRYPLALEQAVKIIAAGKTRQMDICQVNKQYFVNNSAIGLEPTITIIQQEMVWAKGILRYLLAALRGILRNPQWQAEMEWDGGSYRGPISLVSVGNGAVTGGLFYMTPHADLFDGKLTFVHGFRPTRLEILRMLPRTMKSGQGSFVEMEGITEAHATWLKVSLDKPSPAHADGEIFATSIQEIKYQILPGRLKIIA